MSGLSWRLRSYKYASVNFSRREHFITKLSSLAPEVPLYLITVTAIRVVVKTVKG